jgi:hypothetical protein
MPLRSMNMTTDLDTQVPTILDDADLDAVSGGDVRDACVRVALGFLYIQALNNYEINTEINKAGPCPK